MCHEALGECGDKHRPQEHRLILAMESFKLLLGLTMSLIHFAWSIAMGTEVSHHVSTIITVFIHEGFGT